MKKYAIAGLCFATALCALPLFGTIHFDAMDIDSSQYALISRDMIESGDYFFLREAGRRYLDKPILTFWTIAASYQLFGVSNWSFRLPALLLTLLSLYSIYRITVLISGDRRRGLIAAMLYVTAPGLFAMALDPKIDVYLTAYLIFQHHAYYLGVKKNRRWYLLMYACAGLGFVTKGPIAVVIPAISIGMDILVRQDWRRLRSMYPIAGIFIALAPPALWSYVLWLEYESYGPYYFLWQQSFGRFYSQQSFAWSQGYDPLFFVTNFAWAFLPFLLPLVYYSARQVYRFIRDGAYRRLPKALARGRFRDRDFTIPFWLFVFLGAIMFSRYQLPQYIFWILPAAAILTSGIVSRALFGSAPDASAGRATEKELANTPANESGQKPVPTWTFAVVPMLAVPLIALAPFLSFDPDWRYGAILAFVAASGLIFALLLSRGQPRFNFRFDFRRNIAAMAVAATLSSVLGIYWLINAYIYPALLHYQPAPRMAPVLNELEPEESTLYTFLLSFSYKSIPLYTRRGFVVLYDLDEFQHELRTKGSRLVATQERHYPRLQGFLAECCEVETVRIFDAYKVSMPHPKFLLESRRPALTAGQGIVLARATLKNSFANRESVSDRTQTAEAAPR